MIDFSKIKAITIPDGVVTKIVSAGVTLWEAIRFKNWVPLSTDTDGSIFNKTGYKDDVRLSSSGGLSGSAQNGSTTTGFIPINGAVDIVRMKGVEWKNASANYSGHYYLNYYDSSKEFLDYTSSLDHAGIAHVLSVTRDADGVETIQWNNSYGTTNLLLQNVRKASYVRITARGKGADMIVTINEEIT